MSEAKKKIMESLSLVPDSETDEFMVLEDLYKLMKLKKSRKSAETEGTLSTDDIRKYFAGKRQRAVEC